MVSIHSTVGTLVVLGYLAATVLYAYAAAGRPVALARYVSFAAAGLLLVQYVLGFWLLGDGYRNQASHYAFAILALVTVGLEHGFAPTRATPRARASVAGLAALGTLILVVITYLLGQGSIG
jgi:hypothetical protein